MQNEIVLIIEMSRGVKIDMGKYSVENNQGLTRFFHRFLFKGACNTLLDKSIFMCMLN